MAGMAWHGVAWPGMAWHLDAAISRFMPAPHARLFCPPRTAMPLQVFASSIDTPTDTGCRMKPGLKAAMCVNKSPLAAPSDSA